MFSKVSKVVNGHTVCISYYYSAIYERTRHAVVSFLSVNGFNHSLVEHLSFEKRGSQDIVNSYLGLVNLEQLYSSI